MSRVYRRMVHWLSGVLNRRRFDLDLADELAFHIHARVDHLQRNGLSAQEAARQAKVELGGSEKYKDEIRDLQFGDRFEQLRVTVRSACRSLAKSPAYLVTAVLVLGLAIAANSAAFAAVYSVFWAPTAIAEPGRLVIAWETNPVRNQGVVEVSYRNFQDWQRSNHTLTHIAAFGSSAWPLLLEDSSNPIKLSSVGVSSGFFETLGARPFLGRFFQAEDEQTTPIRPLVLSHRFWATRFGADQGVLERTILTEDGLAKIVGVAPPQLDFPRGVDVWLPVEPVLRGVTGVDGFRDVGVLFVVGRLRDQASVEAAAADFERTLVNSVANGGRRFGSAVRLTEFLDYQLGPARGVLSWIWGAAGVLLLMTCGNVAALSLIRAIRRRREQALRLALGASTASVWRSWAIEATVVSVAGAVAGLIAAPWLLAAIVALAPEDLPRLAQASVDGRVLLLTFALCVATAAVTACVPMLLNNRLGVGNELREGGHGTESRSSIRTRVVLLSVQVALCVALMMAAALALRSYRNVHHVELGFDPNGVVALEVDSRLDTPAHNGWVNELTARLKRVPQVEIAGAVHVRPLALGSVGSDSTVVLEGQPNTRRSGSLNPMLNYQSATPDYFSTMQIRVTQGRAFNDGDDSNAARVAMVGESAARTLWPGQNPIGRRLSLPSVSQGEPAATWRTVVGVVEDVHYRGLEDVTLDVYEPAAQAQVRAGYVVVRSSLTVVGVASAVESEARRVEPRTLISGAVSMEAVRDRAMATWTLSVWLFTFFAVTSVLVVCVGLFSSVSVDIARRSREFALRIALGASSRTVVGNALTGIAPSVVVGAIGGVVLAALGERFMSHLLFGIDPLDWVTYGWVVGLAAGIGVAACVAPAFRATRIAPASTLKHD